MRLFKLLLFIVFIGTGNAVAGELDTYYLQQFGELTADSTRSALKSVQEQSARKCGMPLIKSLRSDWQNLEASTQKTLAKYLAKPTLAGEQIVVSNGNHFRIHYATSGSDAPPLADNNTNSIPDWIETVADAFEAVYNREVTQMSYTAPPGGVYDVYLKNMSYFGLTDSDTLHGQSATSYITIENDFEEPSFQASIPGNDSAYSKSVKALQITAAHEFHHAIQFGLNYYFEPWYAEATASWIEDEIFDSVNQLYSYSNSYLANTSASLNSGVGYSRWIFNRSIYEQFYSQQYPENIIWRIWETFAAESASPSGADIPMLPFIDKVLKSQGGSLASSFFSFAKQVYLRNWISHKSEITNFHTVTVIPVNADSSYTITNPNLPSYAFTYYKISHITEIPSSLSISYPDKPSNLTVLAFKDSDKSEYRFDPTTQTITIPVFGSNDSIYLLVCNNGEDNSNIIPLPQTSEITPPSDATNPHTVKHTLLSTPPATSGGSGGRGCFIATAAYGSYLHPEVMTLRDFRDRYLLTNLPGRVFVTLYYRISPPVADFISTHDSARFIVRILLTPIIFAVKHLWLTVTTVTTLILIVAVRVRKRLLIDTAPDMESR